MCRRAALTQAHVVRIRFIFTRWTVNGERWTVNGDPRADRFTKMGMIVRKDVIQMGEKAMDMAKVVAGIVLLAVGIYIFIDSNPTIQNYIRQREYFKIRTKSRIWM